MSLSCSAGKGLCHGFCARKLWNAGRAKELPGSIFPASALQPLPCMIRDPPGAPRAPLGTAIPPPGSRARQLPGIWDLPPCPAPSRCSRGWQERDVPPSPAAGVCSCSHIPGTDSGCTCGCLYWGTVYILGSIMSISGYQCDLSGHIHFSHIYSLLASQEWESFGLFCAAQTLKRKNKEKHDQNEVVACGIFSSPGPLPMVSTGRGGSGELLSWCSIIPFPSHHVPPGACVCRNGNIGTKTFGRAAAPLTPGFPELCSQGSREAQVSPRCSSQDSFPRDFFAFPLWMKRGERGAPSSKGNRKILKFGEMRSAHLGKANGRAGCTQCSP